MTIRERLADAIKAHAAAHDLEPLVVCISEATRSAFIDELNADGLAGEQLLRDGARVLGCVLVTEKRVLVFEC